MLHSMAIPSIDCYPCLKCSGRGCKQCDNLGYYRQPASVNDMYSGGRHTNRRFMTEKGKSWKHWVAENVRFGYFMGKDHCKPKPAHFELWLKWIFPDKRRRDTESYAKAVKDALSGIIWADDSQIYKEHYEKYIAKEWGLIIEWREL